MFWTKRSSSATSCWAWSQTAAVCFPFHTPQQQQAPPAIFHTQRNKRAVAILAKVRLCMLRDGGQPSAETATLLERLITLDPAHKGFYAHLLCPAQH